MAVDKKTPSPSCRGVTFFSKKQQLEIESQQNSPFQRGRLWYWSQPLCFTFDWWINILFFFFNLIRQITKFTADNLLYKMVGNELSLNLAFCCKTYYLHKILFLGPDKYKPSLPNSLSKEILRTNRSFKNFWKYCINLKAIFHDTGHFAVPEYIKM